MIKVKYNQDNLEEKQRQKIALPGIKIYCQAAALKAVWYWQIEQWSRTQDPERDTHMHNHYTYDGGDTSV